MRSKTIEIIGPPGVGKSTVYKELCKKWNSQSCWIYQDLISPKLKPSISRPRDWLEYQVKSRFRKGGNNHFSIDAGLRFADNNEQLAGFLWSHLSNSEAYRPEEAGNRFRSAYFLFRDFSRYQVISENTGSRPCIIDEGLFVKSFFIMPNEETMTDLLEKYFPLLTMPYAVVFLNTTQTDIILDRLEARTKVIASHKGKSRVELQNDLGRWQYWFSLVLDKLKGVSIPVLCLDGCVSATDNAEQIETFLRKHCPNSNKKAEHEIK